VSTVEHLTGPPPLGGLYRAAAMGALRRRTPGGTLPDTALVLADVGVDRARLAGYGRVCGFRVSDRLPPTYPHVLAFPLTMALMSRPEFPLPLVGLVHVANRIEQRRPLHADERFELRVRAENLRPHDRGRQVDLVSEARVGSEPVWRSRSTYLHRQRDRRPDETDHSGQSDGGPTADTSGAAEPAAAGPEPPTATARWRVPRRVGQQYAEVSGDRNPIHTSRLGARLFGFPAPIAHGMWSKARCLAALEGRLPDTYTVDVAFKRPILLPATVGFHAAPFAGGWRFSLHDANSGRPHLAGDLTAGAT
jgi:acyl dehydratase